MAAIIFKCPNCGGELMFDPSTQQYKCEYCGSDFSQEDLEHMEHVWGEEVFDEGGMGGYPGGEDTKESSTAVVYTCPSCGAQIITDETTAALFCYYCHNPVVLSGQLSGEYLPDRIIPFAIDKDAAMKQFLEYIWRRKFVPAAFFDQAQLEKFSGIYYPYWIYGCRMEGRIDGEATKVRVWSTGDTEYTETSVFHVERDGRVSLENMTKNALRESDKALVEGVLPFRLNEMKPFSMGYLSGFFAQRRDVEKQGAETQFHQDAEKYAKNILRDTIRGYSTVNVREDRMELRDEKWQYLLLPVWVLTYAGKNGRRYYYAMNGQTGTICGKLPVDYRKLGIFSGLIGILVFVLCLIGGQLI